MRPFLLSFGQHKPALEPRIANFGKFGVLSKTGWNQANLTQTIELGKSAQIGL